MDPSMIMQMLMPLLGGGLSGLFGGNELPPEYQAMLQKYMAAIQKMQQYANSAPGTQPQESAALAQAGGLLGQQQQQMGQRMNSAWRPFMNTNAAPAMSNLLTNFGSQRGNLDANMYQQFFQDRFNAQQGMPGMIAQGFNLPGIGKPPPFYNQNPPFGQIMGALANQHAYLQGIRGGQSGGGGYAGPGAYAGLAALSGPGPYGGGYDPGDVMGSGGGLTDTGMRMF